MLQEIFIAAAAGGNPSNALSQMGFEHLIHEMTTKPGDFAVSWVVLLTLIAMSAMSWYWTVITIFRATRLKSAADRVVSLFWDTPNAQDAIRAMEEQPASEPFSKIALDAAQAAAHHQRAEGGATGGVGENLSRSEFVDRALRQAVTRESNKLQSGMTLLATVGAGESVPLVGGRRARYVHLDNAASAPAQRASAALSNRMSASARAALVIAARRSSGDWALRISRSPCSRI